MNKYFDFEGIENTSSYQLLVGGRVYGKKSQYLAMMCEILFGGKTHLDYDPAQQCYIITIKNDDVGIYHFMIYTETLDHELLGVRLNRMCEEYDGYMRYLFRDYQGDF